MKRPLIALSALLTLALTGCGSPNPDDAFVSTVRESVTVPAVTESSDEDLVTLGKTVCDTFNDIGVEKGLPLFVQKAKSYGLDASNAGGISGAAVGAYCPEFSEFFTG